MACKHQRRKLRFVYDQELGALAELTCVDCRKRTYGTDPADSEELPPIVRAIMADPLSVVTKAQQAMEEDTDASE